MENKVLPAELVSQNLCASSCMGRAALSFRLGGVLQSYCRTSPKASGIPFNILLTEVLNHPGPSISSKSFVRYKGSVRGEWRQVLAVVFAWEH